MKMFTKKQKDAVAEIVNIGIDKGSATLSQMLDEEILLRVPEIKLISFAQILEEFENIDTNTYHAVDMQFFGKYDGLASFILSTHSANQLAALLTKEDPESEDLIPIKDGVIIEVGSIILNAVMSSFANILAVPFDYRIPQSFEGEVGDLYKKLDIEKFNQTLVCQTQLSLEDKKIEGKIVILCEIESFEKIKNLLNGMID